VKRWLGLFAILAIATLVAVLFRHQVAPAARIHRGPLMLHDFDETKKPDPTR